MRVLLSTAPGYLAGTPVASLAGLMQKKVEPALPCGFSDLDPDPTRVECGFRLSVRGVVSSGRFCSRAQGFTLLEILLALGLVALMASVLIGGTARVLANKPVSADEVFWKASAEARKLALHTGREARLGFADDSEH